MNYFKSRLRHLRPALTLSGLLVCSSSADPGSITGQSLEFSRGAATSSFDGFGEAIAMSEGRVAIGCPERNEVQLFDRTTGASLGTITPDPDEVHGAALFGAALAFSGDIIIIGAPHDNEGNGSRPRGVRQGSVFFYNADTLAFIRELKGVYDAEAAIERYFGHAVATDDTHVVIGATGDLLTGTGTAGSIFIHRVSDGALVRKIQPDDLDGGERFGAALSISEGRVAVGSPGYGLPSVPPPGRPPSRVGRVTVYELPGGAEVEQWVNPSPEQDDNFGTDVAINGDLLIIGAPGVDVDDQDDVGAAYSYQIGTGLVTEFLPPGTPADREFDETGMSVAISGTTGYVAAPGFDEDNGDERDAGTIYQIDLATGDCIGRYGLDPVDNDAHLGGENLNSGVQIGGKLAAEGDTLLAGAPQVDAPGMSEVGAAYIFRAQSGPITISSITLIGADCQIAWQSGDAGVFDVFWSENGENWSEVTGYTGITSPAGTSTQTLTSWAPTVARPTVLFRVERQ